MRKFRVSSIVFQSSRNVLRRHRIVKRLEQTAKGITKEILLIGFPRTFRRRLSWAQSKGAPSPDALFARANTFGRILNILDFRFRILDCRKNLAIASKVFVPCSFSQSKIGNPKSKIDSSDNSICSGQDVRWYREADLLGCFKLIPSSEFLGRSTERFAGFAPLCSAVGQRRARKAQRISPS
jgi:hypothetical protein